MIKLPPDITFAIQLVGFVVFWQLMRVILFTPMQAALRKRAEGTVGVRARAEAMLAETAEIQGRIETALADARREGAKRAEEIRRASEAEEHAILDRYRVEAAGLLERERTSTESQVREARTPLDAEAQRLAESVVARVLGRAA